jgi:hypothetical protein
MHDLFARINQPQPMSIIFYTKITAAFDQIIYYTGIYYIATMNLRLYELVKVKTFQLCLQRTKLLSQRPLFLEDNSSL